MKTEWTLQISLIEKQGQRSYRRAIDLPVATFGERMVDDTRFEGSIGVRGAADAMIKMMKERNFRREEFIAAATRLGMELADHLEDAEGWHGQDRQEKVSKLSRPT